MSLIYQIRKFHLVISNCLIDFLLIVWY